MPAKSKKQRKFMAAVANNPKFAKKVGVPQRVGEEFMKPSKKKYMDGGMAEYDVPKEKQAEMRRQARDEEMDRNMRKAMERYEKTRYGKGDNEETPKKPKKEFRLMNDDSVKSKMAKGGRVGSSCGTKKMAKGGKVRGCGVAKQGVRPCKMY